MQPAPGEGCEPLYDDCAARQLPLPGGGCDDLDLDECGDDPWGPHDWPATTVYVRADAPTLGAAGTRARPFPTITAALGPAFRQGGTVAIAAGRYPESLTLADRFRLGGRCASQVILAGTVIVGGGADVTLHDLTIDGENHETALRVSAGTFRGDRLQVRQGRVVAVQITHEQRRPPPRVELARVLIGPTRAVGLAVVASTDIVQCERCLIEESTGRGVVVISEEAQLRLAHSVVRAIRHSDNINSGVSVYDRGRLILEDFLVSGSTLMGLEAYAGGSLVATRTVVQDTRPRPDRQGGYGITAHTGGEIQLADVVLAHNRGGGLIVTESAHVDGRRVVIRDTRASDAPGAARSGDGVHVMEGGRLELEDAVLLNNELIGAMVTGGESVMHARRLIVRENVARDPNGTSTQGLQGLGVLRGTLTLQDAIVVGNRGVGIGGTDPGGRLEVTNVTIRDTEPIDASGESGVGIEVEGSASALLRDVWLVSNHNVGLLVGGEGTAVEGERVVVRDTRSDGPTGGGTAIAVTESATLDLDDVVAAHNRGFGVAAYRGATLRLRRAVVRDTQPVAAPQATGLGISIADTHLNLDRASVIRSVGAGIVIDENSEAVATHVLVRDTQPLDSPDSIGGGLVVGAGSRLRVDAAWITDNGNAGVLIAAPGAQADLERLTVRRSRPMPTVERTGMGIVALESAVVSLKDARIIDNQEVGLLVMDQAWVHATRLAIRGTRARADDATFGRGGLIENHGRLTLEDALIEDNEGTGLSVSQSSEVTDSARITIRRNGNNGATIQLDSRLEVSGALIDANHAIGLYTNRSTIDATDLIVADTRCLVCRTCQGRPVGIGIAAHHADLSLTNTLVTGNRGLGVGISGDQAHLVATRFAVNDTGRCPEQVTATAVLAQEGAQMDLSLGTLKGNLGYGIMELTQARSTLHAVEIAETAPVVNAEETRHGEGMGIYSDAHLEGDFVRLIANHNHGLVASAATVKLRRSLITSNAVGVLREVEARVDLDETVVADNTRDDISCEDLCSEAPDDMEIMSLLPDE